MDYFVLSKKLQEKLILLQHINPNKAVLFRVLFTGGFQEQLIQYQFNFMQLLNAKQSI